MKCPSPVELERAYWSNDADLLAHAAECAGCRRQVDEIGALADLGRAIAPAPTSPQRREELRTTLLSKVGRAPERAPARRWPLVVAPLAAAAAIALAWWAWPEGTPPPAREPEEVVAPAVAEVLDHGGARYLHSADLVRLVDGTITIHVPGDRFRVITGDAEIIASGAAFDVTAERDTLLAVRVVDGQVEIRAAGGEPTTLRPGDTWRATLLDTTTAALEPPPAPAPAPPPRRRSVPAPAPAPVPAPAPAPVPDAAQLAFDTGWRAIQSGDYITAAASFERATTTADAQLAEDAGYWHAVALARGGETGDAILAFEAFLDAHPGATRAGEASAVLGWLLYDRGDHDAAARRFGAAADDPSPRVRQSAADGLRAVGKHDG